MKFKALTIVLMMICFVGFGQKKEIRQAENAIENQKLDEAEDLLKKVEPQLSSLNDSYKGRYYHASGFVLAMKGIKTGDLDDLKKAGQHLVLADELGEEEAKEGLGMIEQILVNGGIQDQNAENFESAYKKLYTMYEINPQDTLYLLAAANNAFNAQLDDKAIELFERLRDIGYVGNDLEYVAVEKATGKEEVFPSASTRDVYVQSGEYIRPSVRRAPSKAGDVVRQLAFLYLRNDQKEKALEAIEISKKSSGKDDIQILKAEAIIYQQMEETQKLHDLLMELIRKDPDGAATYYLMLGDAAMEKGDEKEAINLFESAIEADPTNVEAYNSMANIHLSKQEALVDEMNTLGMSKADTKRYDELSAQRNKLLEKALPYVEKILENDPENVEVMQSLYQLHSQLRNREEAQKYKEMWDENK